MSQQPIEATTTIQSKNTYWFYKWPLWLRIVLCVFLFPIFLPILVWPLIKLPIGGKLGLLAVWIIVVLFVYTPSTSKENDKLAVTSQDNSSVSSSISSKSSESSSQSFIDAAKSLEDQRLLEEQKEREAEIKAKEDEEKRKQDEIKAEEQKLKDEAQRIEDAKPENMVRNLPSKIFKGQDGYSAELKGNIATLNFDVSKGDFWDDKHILEQMLGDFVVFGREAQKVEGVAKIDIYYKSKLIDSFGKEMDGELMWVNIAKSDFEKYNFNNLKGRNFYERVSDTAIIWVLPNTRSGIDFSQVNVTRF